MEQNRFAMAVGAKVLRFLLYSAGWVLLAPLLIADFLLWAFALIALLAPSWAVLALVPAAIGGSAAAYFLHRFLTHGRSARSGAWDSDIQAELAKLPPSWVSRSIAGEGGWLGANPLLATAAGLLVVGLIGGTLVAYGLAPGGPADPGWEQAIAAGIGFMAVVGVVAGILLGFARDSRGKRVTLSAAIGVPATFALFAAFSGEDISFTDRLIAGAGVFVAGLLPVLIGYTVVSRLFNGAPKAVPTASSDNVELPPELKAATRRGRALALIREYELGEDGRRYLTEDEELLRAAGYRRAAEGDRDRPSLVGGGPRHVVLFVRTSNAD